jgi:transmembrane sensor
LTLPPDYGRGDREVGLVGVALFEVMHGSHPFRVRSGNAVIEDLGTTFSVRDDDDGVRVVVTAGSVLLQGVEKPRRSGSKSTREGVVLKAGDRGAVDREGRPVAERSTAGDQDLAWTRGRLVFDNAPLSRVRADVRRWYGVELQIADSALAGRHLTTSFAGEPVEQVLDVIALALGARIERRGDIAVVRAR